MNRYFIFLCMSLIWSASNADDLVPVNTTCVINHNGYKGTIVEPGISEPSGKISKLLCDNKKVELKSNEMIDGLIDTKHYGKVKVRFSSNISTVGAGDFIGVPPGKFIEWNVRDISVSKTMVDKFSSKYANK